MIYQQYEDTSGVYKRSMLSWMFEGKTDLEILEETLSVRQSRQMPMTRAVVEVERTWVLFGRPYFKISPVMVRELSHTSIDIPGQHLELPYDGFTVLLPVDMEFDFLKRFPPLRALLVGWCDNPQLADPRANRTLLINFQFDAPHPTRPGTSLEYNICPGVYNNLDIEKALLASHPIPWDTQRGVPAPPTPEEALPLVRIAICTAFFGIDAHELVRPDLTRKKQVVYQRAAVRGDQSKMKEIEDKFEGKYKIGFEIDVPTAEVTYVRMAKPDDEPGEIKHAYMRRGHLRRQAIGPRSNPDHKIVFIRPHAVRPDLPFKADSMVQGYKVPEVSPFRKDNDVPNTDKSFACEGKATWKPGTPSESFAMRLTEESEPAAPVARPPHVPRLLHRHTRTSDRTPMIRITVAASMAVATIGLIYQSYPLLLGPLIVNVTLAAWTWGR